MSYYAVEVLHVWSPWWGRVLLMLGGYRWRAWIGPAYAYSSEPEAVEAVPLVFRSIAEIAEQRPSSLLRPTQRWRVVHRRGTPWAEGEIIKVLHEGLYEPDTKEPTNA
jgi:hypothetical protein